MGWVFVFLEEHAPGAIGTTIFYLRLMLIGVLLILLIIYRPEGILRERKRVLRCRARGGHLVLDRSPGGAGVWPDPGRQPMQLGRRTGSGHRLDRPTRHGQAGARQHP